MIFVEFSHLIDNILLLMIATGKGCAGRRGTSRSGKTQLPDGSEAYPEEARPCYSQG